MIRLNTQEDEDSYIANENSEIAIGEAPHWTDKIFFSLPALKSRNYSLYFFGQLISMIGTWLQIVAEGWLIFQLSKSAYYVGLSAAASTIPSLFLSLIGGVIVDRFPKKKILMITQIASMFLAFILGILTILNVITVWHIIVLAFLLGIIQAVDIPARQAYMVELVDDKTLLSSAIALNSTIYNSARVIGPTIAGFLIAAFGLGTAFMLNGVSYIAVVIALLFINTKPHIPKIHPSPIKAISEGLNYAFSHPTIKILLISTVVMSVFGWSYSTLMPVIAHTIFYLDAAGLGLLYAATGTGALIATIIISAFSQKINPYLFIIGGCIISSIGLIIFSTNNWIYLAYILLPIIGFCTVGMFATTNILIQNSVTDHMRGRVISIYTLAFMGFSPLGSFEIGFIADKFGSQIAICINAIIVLFFGLYFYKNLNNLKKNQEVYDQMNNLKPLMIE